MFVIKSAIKTITVSSYFNKLPLEISEIQHQGMTLSDFHFLIPFLCNNYSLK